MEWLKRLHICLAASPWIAAIYFRQAWIIILCLAVHVIVITQWAILGNCILNRIENEGASDDADWMIYFASVFQIPIEELKHGMILVNGLAPNFLHLSRLAGALGL